MICSVKGYKATVRVWCLLFALVFALLGCGGGGNDSNGGGGGNTGVLSVVPSTVSLRPNEEEVFSAAGASEVAWSVDESGGGTISASGRYKAPTTVGTYHVVATSGARTARATVNVTNGATVSLFPLQATVPGGETFKFTAEVRNGTGTPVLTVVEAGGGTIDASGTYTAPTTPGTYHVRATLAGDASSTTEATVTVTDVVSVAINDGPRFTSLDARLTLASTVAGSTDTSVAWTASQGTIDANGKFLAPDRSGTVTITATSIASPSRKASVTVKVLANPAVRFKFEGKEDVVLRLNTGKAPKTSANLVSLVNEKFYDGIKVHRLEPNFVVQWGDPLTKTLPLDDPSIGTGGPGYTIPFEANSLKNVKFALGMARGDDKDSGGSQIYVCLRDQPTLDGKYTVFGAAITKGAVLALAKGDKIVSASVEP